ncbi:hypothetical protein HY469_00235 [Candidatus Roizmanbacteria bacterium]|nr:hypothetical protein [Candidatus Roizmanbacteria bacterium]
MSIEFFIFVLAGSALVLVLGIIISVISEKSPVSRGKKEEERENSPLAEAQIKSNSIIQSAMKQARALLVNAELTGIKEVARTRYDTKKLEDAYEGHLQELIRRSEKHLEYTTRTIEEHYIELFKTAEKQITAQIADNQQRIVNELDLVLDEAHTLLMTQTKTTSQQMEQHLQAEIQAAKELVEQYRTKRTEGIDRQITELVIETVKRTIDKALNPQEHTDLIIRSLEEAKQDGFFT